MGSFFAGIKAGTLGGIFYVGGLGIFNAVLLLALKSQVIAYINQDQTFHQLCSPGTALNMTGLNQCFSSVLIDYIPVLAFVGFFVALFYCGLFGMFYEWFPGRGTTGKGELISGIIGLNIVYFGFYGFAFDVESDLATGTFLIIWTLLLGYLVGKLYTRYTRSVVFQSQDPNLLKILVDGKNLTGKTRTFATTSSHKIRAEVTDDASFKEWEISGGVSLEDARSFETIMEVNGDGLLKARVGKKY